MDEKAILEELLARQRGKFDITQVCFDKQVAFITDPSKLKTLVAGRRAGKTYACAVYLLSEALRIPKCKILYLAITKDYAKSLIWDTLHDLNAEYGLGAHFTESKGIVTINNGSSILISGADNAAEVRKFRGHGVALSILDEAQNFRGPIITDLIENVLSKALYDFDGTLVLAGTPPPVPVGYFYECAVGRTNEAGSFAATAYSTHKWTMFDNPHLKAKSGRTADYLLQQDLKRKGVTIDDPSIRREVFAEWVTDSNALVFKYSSSINNYTDAPPLTEFVIGVDLGFDDADAIAVLGWSAASPDIYLVEEAIKRGQTVTELAEEVDRVLTKYQPLRIVMDTGGLGKKLAEELRKRYALPVVAAEKSRKFEFIELLNDALRTGRFRAKTTSQFAQDCYLVEWDRKNSQKLAIKDTFHSDITDAALYAYREALHWLFTPAQLPIAKGSSEWYKQVEAEIEERLIKELEDKQEPKEGLPSSDDYDF